MVWPDHLLQVPLVATSSRHVGVISSKNSHTPFRHLRIAFKVELDDDEIWTEFPCNKLYITLLRKPVNGNAPTLTCHSRTNAILARFIRSSGKHAATNLERCAFDCCYVDVLGRASNTYTKWFSLKRRGVEKFHAGVKCVHVNVHDGLTEVTALFELLNLKKSLLIIHATIDFLTHDMVDLSLYRA